MNSKASVLSRVSTSSASLDHAVERHHDRLVLRMPRAVGGRVLRRERASQRHAGPLNARVVLEPLAGRRPQVHEAAGERELGRGEIAPELARVGHPVRRLPVLQVAVEVVAVLAGVLVGPVGQQVVMARDGVAAGHRGLLQQDGRAARLVRRNGRHLARAARAHDDDVGGVVVGRLRRLARGRRGVGAVRRAAEHRQRRAGRRERSRGEGALQEVAA